MQKNLLIQHQTPATHDPDLSAYRQVIDSLAPLVNKGSFNTEFQRQTQSIPVQRRFLVKMEIKRLAKLCIRSIDLRTIVKDECSLFTYRGIDHYLNVSGILTFEHALNQYDAYTFGVYEAVLNQANKEKEQYLLAQKSPQTRPEITIPDEKYITPCQELLTYPTRKQERLNYVVNIEVFFADNSSVHGSTLDISINGLRIKLKNAEMLHKVKSVEPIQIVFRGLDKNFGLSRESIEYQVLGISGLNDKANIHLYRTGKKNQAFDLFVDDLIKINKHRYKVNLDNVEMALASKIYEQSFSNNTPTLPVFICRDKHNNYHARYASVNANNKHIVDYWLDENGDNLLGFLLNPSRIAQLLNNSSAYPQMTIYSFNHIKDDKVYFYSATPQELVDQPDISSTFLAYASRKVSWRVFQLTISDIMPSDAFSPSSIPDGVSKKVDILNKALSPRLQSALGNICNMISLTDISCSAAQAYYQTKKLHKQKIKFLKIFGHARNKIPILVDTYRHKQQELRRQTRYILRTKVTITSNTQRIIGVTEDVSVSGLKIELDKPFTQRLNSKVSVGFERLQQITENFELQKLQYRVVHVHADKYAIHLQALAEDEMSVAERFFTQLLANNSDKLKTVDKDEEIEGIGMALRNLHAKNSPQFCTYVEKKPQGFLPAMSTISQVRAKWMDFLHHDKSLAMVDLSWLYQDTKKGKDYVNHTLKLLRLDPRPIKTQIFIAKPAPEQLDNQTPHHHLLKTEAQWLYEFSSHRAQQRFIKEALNAGDFFAFSVTLNKALKPDLEKIEQEILYLSQHAIHKASYFEERMWDIAGAIFLTDITPEVLFRFQLRR